MHRRIFLVLGSLFLGLVGSCKQNEYSDLQSISERSQVANAKGLFLVCAVPTGDSSSIIYTPGSGQPPLFDLYCGVEDTLSQQRLSDDDVANISLMLYEGKVKTPIFGQKIVHEKWHWKIRLDLLRALKADDLLATASAPIGGGLNLAGSAPEFVLGFLNISGFTDMVRSFISILPVGETLRGALISGLNISYSKPAASGAAATSSDESKKSGTVKSEIKPSPAVNLPAVTNTPIPAKTAEVKTEVKQGTTPPSPSQPQERTVQTIQRDPAKTVAPTASVPPQPTSTPETSPSPAGCVTGDLKVGRALKGQEDADAVCPHICNPRAWGLSWTNYENGTVGVCGCLCP